MTSFTKKAIEVRIKLSAGSFSAGGDTKVIRGLPVQATIEKLAAPDINKATIKVWGMKLEDMARLTTLAFQPLEAERNIVEILAGDEDAQSLSSVFAGEITLAFANFSTAPEVSFDITAMTGAYPMQMAIPPTSAAGSVPVADVISRLAQSIGYSFQNEGVMASLFNPVLSGSPIEQIRQAARQAGVQAVIDDSAVILLAKDKPRKGAAVLLSKDTGLIGYPSFNNVGIVCSAIYDPAFQMGGQIKVESIVPKATGSWMITKLTHTLSAYIPQGGDWKSDMEAAYVG